MLVTGCSGDIRLLVSQPSNLEAGAIKLKKLALDLPEIHKTRPANAPRLMSYSLNSLQGGYYSRLYRGVL